MLKNVLILALLAFALPGKAQPAYGAPAPAAPEIRVPVVGISTNIPYDLTWVPGYGVTSVPSFSVEYFPARWERWTVGADVEWPMWKHWKTHRFLQINNLTLWTRRYFHTRARDSRPEGLYLLANANAVRYGIGYDEKGWKGEALGISAGIGYRRGIGKSRWYVDAGLALGFLYSRYDPYVWGGDATGWYYYDYTGDPAQFVPRRMALYWTGPTRVFVSVGMDLYRKKKK